MKTYLEIAERMVNEMPDLRILQEPNAGHYLARIIPIKHKLAPDIFSERRDRIGRDLEIYQFMNKIKGPEVTICDFLAEVGIPLKSTPAYPIIREELTVMGREIFSENELKEWTACLV